MEYDGVLSLGCWCQVGAIMWEYQLKAVYTPFDNIGIKQWQRLMDLLESRFDELWERENMAIGSPADYFSLKYREISPVYKVYDNKYNLVSSHHFDVVDNTPDELHTYDDFKERMDVLQSVFFKQCETYERVLFVCKIMSLPETETIIERNDIKRLCSALNDIREQQPYDLRISVPHHLYQQVLTWIEEDQLKNIQVYPWTEEWNENKEDEEWKFFFGDVKLSDHYIQQLNEAIIGITDPDSQHLEYLRS